MGHSKVSKQRASAQVVENQALELRRTGATYEQIAKQLGMSETSARRYVERAYTRLRELATETVAEIRQMETDRLDAMLLSIWPRVQRGELRAIDRALTIHRARVKMYGLEMPLAPPPQEAVVVKFEDGDEK